MIHDGSSRNRAVACEVRDANNDERHACGRRRDGEAAVSCMRSRKAPRRT